MLESILRSFKAAWKWPEVVHETRGMIYISRALLAFLPVLSIASTLANGQSHNLFAAIMFSIAIGVSFIIAIFLLFRGSHYRVERYESIAAKAKNVFNQFPQFSDCEIMQRGHSWVGYGHIKPHLFVQCICKIISGITNNQVNTSEYIKDENYVEHRYARFLSDSLSDEHFEFCEINTIDSFPVTVLDI